MDRSGIDLDPDQPGYKHILMHPQPGGGLTHATAELHSMYGTIRSAWKQDGHAFDWQIIIPANTIATVYVPAQDVSGVTENGQPAQGAPGIKFLRMANGAAVFRLMLGSYLFSSRSA